METNISDKPDKKRISPMGAVLKYGVPLVITVGLCWLLFNGMDLKAMWATMTAECDFRWMWGNLLLTLAAQVARAARWQIQLKALGVKATFWELCLSVFGTYSVNLVFPRLGEVWRCGFIAERERAPFTKVFGSMVADRLSDTVCVGLITLFTFCIAGSQLMTYLSQDPDKLDGIIALATSPWLWGLIIACMAVVLWVFIKYPEHTAVLKVKGVVKGLWEGFAVIVKMPGKGRWLLFTLCIWASYVLSQWFALKSFGLTSEMLDLYGLTPLMVCFSFTSLSMAVPSNGGIGPYQWAMIFALSLYSAGIPGLDYLYSAAFANMLMGTQTLLLIVLGIFTFSWIALTKKSRQ